MNPDFDLVWRIFAKRQTRRQLVEKLAAVLLSGIGGPLVWEATAAKDNRKKKSKGSSNHSDRDRNENRHKGHNDKNRRKKDKRKNCPPCRRAKNGHCKTKRRDGTACGSCKECQRGRCVAISQGPECTDLSFCYTTIPDVYKRTDVASLIHFRTPAEAENRRSEVIDFIWKGVGLPSRQNVGTPPPAELTSANDGFSVQVGDLVSYVAWWRTGASKLAIYHAGHSHELGEKGGTDTINRLLERGHDVLGMWMPGFGPNTRLGPNGGWDHEVFRSQETTSFSPLVYFLEPIAVAINYALGQEGYDEISIIGLSGGGWTTTLYAAIDPRIRLSVPVAGTAPLYLHQAPCWTEPADWEQAGSAFWQHFDYTELYVLAAYGPGREQIQVVNQFDTHLVLGGVRYLTYEPAVQEIVAGLGEGAFRVLLDSTHRRHIISTWALNQVVG